MASLQGARECFVPTSPSRHCWPHNARAVLVTDCCFDAQDCIHCVLVGCSNRLLTRPIIYCCLHAQLHPMTIVPKDLLLCSSVHLSLRHRLRYEFLPHARPWHSLIHDPAFIYCFSNAQVIFAAPEICKDSHFVNASLRLQKLLHKLCKCWLHCQSYPVVLQMSTMDYCPIHK